MSAKRLIRSAECLGLASVLVLLLGTFVLSATRTGGVDPRKLADIAVSMSPVDSAGEFSYLDVANVSSSAATISWVSRTSGEAKVQYGLTPRLGSTATGQESGRIHAITITGLEPDATIYYKASLGGESTETRSFTTASVVAGRPQIFLDVIPDVTGPSQSVSGDPVLVRIRATDEKGTSQPLVVRTDGEQYWAHNLGNLKTVSGGVFPYGSSTSIWVEILGVDSEGYPRVLYEYERRATEPFHGAVANGLTTIATYSDYSPPPPMGLHTTNRTTERGFLEGLLAKGAESRLSSCRGRGYPHFVPGWVGGIEGYMSQVPEPEPVPNRIRLRGENVLAEIVRLRNERSDAKSFFPDVARHFDKLPNYGQRASESVTLYPGINIVALPLNPTDPVSSFDVLTDNANVTELTAWDGELQLFGAAAIKVGENIIGDDFKLNLGYGYFATSSAVDSIVFQGETLTRAAYVATHPGLEVVSLVGDQHTWTSFTLFDSLFSGHELCRLNPLTQAHECAFLYGASVVGDEFPIQQGTGYFVRTSGASSFPVDNVPPSLTVVAPADADTVYHTQPFIDIVFGDNQLGIDSTTFACTINGQDRTPFFEVSSLGATWQVSESLPLVEGTNTVQAWITDLLGNQKSTSATFDVVVSPPPVDSHFINGYVYHGDTWEPLEGAAVTIDSISGVVYTDTSGHYVFPIPGLGDYRIDISKEHFTYAQIHTTIENGFGDAIVDDAYLSPRDSVSTRITEIGGVAVNSDGSVFASFPPDIVAGDIDVSALNLDEGEDLPSPLPELSIFTYCVKYWPDKVEFADSAAVDQFNMRGFASGTPIPIGHYNSESMEWEDEGMAYVSADDTWFDYSLSHFMSWVDVNLPVQERPEPDPDNIDDPEHDCGSGKFEGSPALGYVKLKFGGSVVNHELPSVLSFGENRSVTLTYASHTAHLKSVIESATRGIPMGTWWPMYSSSGTMIGWTKRRCYFSPSHSDTWQRVRFEPRKAWGYNPPTGVYYYKTVLTNWNFSEYMTAASFGGPPVAGTGVFTDFPVRFSMNIAGNVMIDNRLESAIGTGWAVDGVQRLHFRPDGDVLITEGGSAATYYERTVPVPVLDLVVMTRVSSSGGYASKLYTYFGDGEGGLVEDSVYGLPLCEIYGTMGVADIDASGTDDVLAMNLCDNKIYVRLNDGNGKFGSAVGYSCAIGGAYKSAQGDFNNDGFCDVATIAQNGRYVGINLADGSGGLDAGQVFAFAGSNQWMHGIAIGDFDIDSCNDVTITGGYPLDDFMKIGLGTCTGEIESFSPSFSVPDGRSITVGEFNGDGYQDVVVARDWAVYVFINDQSGGFYDAQSYSCGNWPMGARSADFNKDGFDDLVTANSENSTVSVLLNDKNGNLGDRTDYPCGSYPWDLLEVGDLNGDGFADIITGGKNDKEVVILFNNGYGEFSDRVDIAVGDQTFDTPSAIRVCDLNGDVYVGDFRSQDGDYTTLTINDDSTGYTRIYPDSSKVVFDTAGLHAATIDRNGNTTTYEYDDQQRLTSITHPGSLITTFEYGIGDKVETITDPAGRETNINHDIFGNLISITDPDGSFWEYEYEDQEEHLLTKIIDPRGNETIYVYDSIGHVDKVIGPDSATNEVLASNAYNTIDEATAAGEGTPENPATPVTSDMLVNYFVNTKGDTTRILTNKFGRPTEKTDVLGRVHRMEYNEHGEMTAQYRPDSTAVTMTYDDWGNLLSVTDEETGAVVEMQYDPVYHLLQRVEDAEDNVTTVERDSLGNPARIINALGDTSLTFFDSAGLLTKIITPLGDSVTFLYDDTGRLVANTNPLGYSTTLERDSTGNITAVIDANGYRTEYKYDNLNRLTLRRDALGYETQYVYDSSGNITAHVNAEGDTTHYAYDEYNRLVSTIDPLGFADQYAYDTEHLLRFVVTPNGDTIENLYDAAGRLTHRVLTGQDSTVLQYDLVDNLTLVEDAVSRIEYEYDPSRRLTAVVTGDTLNPSVVQPYVRLDYVRDLNNRVTHRIDSRGDTLEYVYDGLNRVIGIVDGADTTHYTYDVAGRRDSVTRTNGAITRYTYDPAGNLLDLTHVLGSDSIAVFHYEYDSVGNRKSVTDLYGYHSYQYDSLYQLTGAIHPQAYNPTESYTYDELGNRIASHLSALHITDANNRLLENDSAEFGWDNSGRRIWERRKSTGDTTFFEYNADDELVRAYNDTMGVLYVYDAIGHRIQRTLVTNGGVDTSMAKYSYDGLHLLFEHDSDDPVDVRYYYGPGIDALLETSGDVDSGYHFSDALGSVVRTIDVGGLSTKSMVYDTYGNLVSDSGTSSGDEVGYTGRELDRELGLHYYRARWYDASIGRFASRDPLGFAGDVNLYRYVGNRVPNRIDPFGLKCKDPESDTDQTDPESPTDPDFYDDYWNNKAPDIYGEAVVRTLEDMFLGFIAVPNAVDVASTAVSPPSSYGDLISVNPGPLFMKNVIEATVKKARAEAPYGQANYYEYKAVSGLFGIWW